MREPIFLPDLIRDHDGLEVMQMLLDGRLPNAPMADTLDFRLIEVERGRVAFEGTPGPAVYNLIGTVHGGYAATLLDSALACAIFTTLPRGSVSTTTDLALRYVRGITTGSGPVRAEASVVHAGRRMATAEGRVTGTKDGKLYVHGSTSCMIVPLEAR